MNTLLIAPDSNLVNTPDEARHIQEALNAQVINGRVTPIIVADAIANRIARHQTIDMIFFIGHGNLTGLQLTDGYMSIADLCRYIKSANIRYLVLNTCESEYIALAIHHETNATVICTISPVADTQAYGTSRLLAESIANGYPVEEAYERAKPSGAGPSQYRIFTNKSGAEKSDDEHQTIKMMYALFSRLEKQMNSFRDEMMKEIANIRAELMREIEKIRSDIKPLENRMYTINERTGLPITISVAAAITAFIVLIWSIFGVRQ